MIIKTAIKRSPLHGYRKHGKIAKPFLFFFTLLLFACFSYQTVSARTVSIAVSKEPQTIDPQKYTEAGAETYIFPCYQRLVEFKEDTNEVKPSLALTWRVSDNGLLYTFVLREGASFSDGRKLDARAVYLSFDRAMRPGFTGRKYFPTLKAVSILGPNTIRFILSSPDPSFLKALASPAASIISSGVDEHAADYLDKHSLGSGEYRIEKWDPGKEIVLKTKFGGKGQALPYRFKGIIEPDSEKRLRLLINHKVQAAADLTPFEAEVLDENPMFLIRTASTFSYISLALNCGRPWTSVKDARKALAIALDYDALLARLGMNAAKRLYGPVPKGMEGSSPDLRKYEYSPEKATELLESTGLPEAPLLLLFDSNKPVHRDMAIFIGENLESFGLKVELLEKSGIELATALDKGRFDIFIETRRPIIASADSVLKSLYFSSNIGAKGNTAHYKNLVIDRFLKDADLTMDKRKRRSILNDVQNQTAEDAPYIFLFQLNKLYGLSMRFRDAVFHPMTPDVFPLGLNNNE